MVDFLKKINGTHLGIFVISLFFTAQLFAGPTDDNHIHVEQVEGGDDVSLTINQLGYGNEVQFSFALPLFSIFRLLSALRAISLAYL